ncbi:DUF3182 family protein [Xanthomonas campestris pv. raphani]|uniref:DUF3182 family protein n=1 Tax=Xanthomonas campestris TaxID=339 RepID=UPI002B23824B|nr:DUF3182 family protein [Xanthomonas campestris]MEA9913552.1 DUF3182 family protein [Xanthomonas campestris pv. raphani]
MQHTHYRQVRGHTLRDVPHDGHEHATHAWVCAEVARLLGVRNVHAESNERVQHDGGAAAHTLHIPDETLTVAQARTLGIQDTRDVLGGVVPYAFLATKVIGHPLITEAAQRVDGWNQALAMALMPATLPGYTVFSRADATQAAAALRKGGGVRLKLPTGVGGNGQWRIDDAAQLDAALDALPPAYLATHGAVLERNVVQPHTHSVGELCIGGIRIAYYGTQCSVRDGNGAEVYGGSSLRVYRGSLEALAASALPPLEKQVVAQACMYDRFITAAYPALQISRRNYDVVSGQDAQVGPVCGVLEQSWRVGGATPAELAAIASFQQDPALRWVTASTHELYEGDAPDDVQIYYRAQRPGPGPRVKYRRVSTD